MSAQPYSRRAGRICGAPVAREDVPRVNADFDDGLNAARGILNACLLGAVVWVLVALFVWAIVLI